MSNGWQASASFQRIAATLRKELPQLPTRGRTPQDRDRLHHRRRRLLFRVVLLLRRIPNAALEEIVPGVRSVHLGAFIRPGIERRTNLRYFRQDRKDGFGYRSKDYCMFGPAERFEEELLNLDIDRLLKHLPAIPAD